MTTPDAYWFRAKRYGFGWGLPSKWQGWMVLAIWLGIVSIGIYALRRQHPFAFAALLGSSTALYVWVCYAKGEPAKWRWGE
jgi:hypothetical protein